MTATVLIVLGIMLLAAPAAEALRCGVRDDADFAWWLYELSLEKKISLAGLFGAGWYFVTAGAAMVAR